MRKTLSIILALILLLLFLGCDNAAEPTQAQINPTIHESANHDVTPLPWNLLLVNPWNPLPDDHAIQLKELRNGYCVDERIYPDLQEMFDNARAENIQPLIVSAYRTYDKQSQLYQDKVSSYLDEGYTQNQAEEMAAKWVAKPNHSEHQTGLAIDINAESGSNDDVYEWLSKNSYKYGFILRYPNEKTEITGIHYEPWHYRYVGKQAAQYINEKQITLEEYLAEQTTPLLG